MTRETVADATWNHFWLGLTIVCVFAILSTLFVVGVAGTRAGADYGLTALLVALLASTVDGIVLSARRRGR